MSVGAYELLALCMRYVFAALMILIVVRIWRATVVDYHRANELRRLSPETGIIGEMLVLNGDGRTRSGMRFPLIREGTIGSASSTDIRLLSRSVRRRHAFFQMTRDGLLVRGQSGAKLGGDGVETGVRERLINDGDVLNIGKIRLMLILADGEVGSARRNPAAANRLASYSGNNRSGASAAYSAGSENGKRSSNSGNTSSGSANTGNGKRYSYSPNSGSRTFYPGPGSRPVSGGAARSTGNGSAGNSAANRSSSGNGARTVSGGGNIRTAYNGTRSAAEGNRARTVYASPAAGSRGTGRGAPAGKPSDTGNSRYRNAASGAADPKYDDNDLFMLDKGSKR